MTARVVLVIEDNPVSRKLVRLTLGSEGYTVIEATEGVEALAMAVKTVPDLILQDLLLPDMDGFELVDRLRALPELVGVPIIAFSGFLSRLEYGRAAAAGFTDFVPKPVEPSHLVQVVRAHLPPEPAMPAETRPGRRALVVDDDPVQLKLTKLRLTALGWEVATARDGVEALDVLKLGGIGVVISDVLMPHLDGFGLSVAIRRDPRLSRLPIILVSSNYVEEADRQLARTMGANAFVVRTPDLAGVIQAADAAIATPVDALVPSVHPDPGEHQQRVLCQLDRQAAMNAALAHRSSMHASMLSVVAGICETLTIHQSVERVLPDILASLLDASGVSRGALFVRDGRVLAPGAPVLDGIALRAHVGFDAPAADDLTRFFAHREIFQRAVVTKSPIIVGAVDEGSAGRDLLARAGVESVLLVPFIADQECLGIFLLASKTRDLTEGDWLPFGRTVAVQIGQALALSRSFAKLAASESRYRLLVESANDGIFTLDAKGTFLDLNPAMERFLGRPRSEVIGATTSVFVAPDDRDRAKRESELLQERGSFQAEARRFTRPDGSVVLGDVSSNVADRVNGIELCILRDVTEKDRVERETRMLQSLALAASEAPNASSAFEVVLRSVCETNGWTVGAAWLPQPEKGFLECATLWTREPAARARFQPLGERAFALGEGVLGRAWASRTPLWVADLAMEAGCARSATAAALGVHAALVVPVVVKDDVIAVVEFFMDHVCVEEEGLARIASESCAQLGAIITRKRAEDALRASEARFARLADSGIIGIAIANVRGNIHEANAALLAMVGFTREELAAGAVRWSALTPPEFKGANDAAVDQLQKHGVAPPYETEIFRRDGSRLSILCGLAMLEYPNVIATWTDISERKRAENLLLAHARVAALGGEVGIALNKRQALREALQQCCESVVLRLDAAFARIWTLDSARKVLELQASAGMYTHIDGPHALVPVGSFEIGRIAESGEPHHSNNVLNEPWLGDCDWARREGMRSFAGYPLLAGGQVVAVIAMFGREPLTDIALDGFSSIADAIGLHIQGAAVAASNRSLENQLRQAQKMEAVGRLAGGVAHDFNNLLSVILSYSEMVSRELKAGDPMRDDVDEIRTAGTRAAELTRQLLTFSRQQVIEPKVLDIRTVLSSMEKMLQRILGEDVDLVSRSNPALWRVKMDPSSLEQVIMNLVVNARDAMPTGGKLTIEASNVNLDETFVREHVGATPGPHVMLAVSDNGMGMDRETQAHIFEPFFTTKDKDKGTGLGLSTVYGIILQSGGIVSVYSEPGRGTSFKVYLPRVNGVLDTARAQDAHGSLRGTETILLVEDEDQVRLVASTILRKQGYRIFEARHAGEALLLCEGQSDEIHLLLTDVVMPRMSGPELAKRLVQIRPRMRVLCMSGYTDDSIVRHGVLQADIAYLQKPITPQTLAKKVREVLDAPPGVQRTNGAEQASKRD